MYVERFIYTAVGIQSNRIRLGFPTQEDVMIALDSLTEIKLSSTASFREESFEFVVFLFGNGRLYEFISLVAKYGRQVNVRFAVLAGYGIVSNSIRTFRTVCNLQGEIKHSFRRGGYDKFVIVIDIEILDRILNGEKIEFEST